MKKELLKYLICPKCGGEISLIKTKESEEEIEEGSLQCLKCSVKYPIIKFIPRFVKNDGYVHNFSFQWNRWRKDQIDAFRNLKEAEEVFPKRTGFNLNDLKDKNVLDVGCGAGRFVEIISNHGGNIFGVDFSYSIDAAFENFGKRKNVHLIQADVFELPFRKEIFDFIFSIGVLHHTVSTEQAIKKLPFFLKHSGKLAVWLYNKSELFFMSERYRRFTTKMPDKLLYYLTFLAVPYYYLTRIRLIGNFFYILFPISQYPEWHIRWLETYDWYSPKYQWKHDYPEVFRWFEECNLKNIRPLEFPITVIGEK